jgi:hypothetical protein
LCGIFLVWARAEWRYIGILILVGRAWLRVIVLVLIGILELRVILVLVGREWLFVICILVCKWLLRGRREELKRSLYDGRGGFSEEGKGSEVDPTDAHYTPLREVLRGHVSCSLLHNII